MTVAVSRRWVGPDGSLHPGLGLVPTESPPAVGEVGTVATRPAPALGLPVMVGWISADVITVRDDGCAPLVDLVSDPRGASSDGILSGHVIGTRLHGPVLALNPELPDLAWRHALGRPGWPPLVVPSVERARSTRLRVDRSTLASTPTSLGSADQVVPGHAVAQVDGSPWLLGTTGAAGRTPGRRCDRRPRKDSNLRSRLRRGSRALDGQPW
jgi:hypothetical protein